MENTWGFSKILKHLTNLKAKSYLINTLPFRLAHRKIRLIFFSKFTEQMSIPCFPMEGKWQLGYKISASEIPLMYKLLLENSTIRQVELSLPTILRQLQRECFLLQEAAESRHAIKSSRKSSIWKMKMLN